MRVHGLAPGLNYGQQALEGFKAFRMADKSKGICLFRPDRNALRFQHSAEMLSMPCVPVEMFLRACRAAVVLNAEFVPPHESGGALYIRPLLYGSSAQLPPGAANEYTFSVFVAPLPDLRGVETSGTKAALILDDFDRAAPRGIGHAKAGGNYAGVLRWSDKAKAEGFGLTLHLDSARHQEVDEFSTCAFIGVISSDNDSDDVTLVSPSSPCAIDSVTSDSLQHIARSFGWKVEKRPVAYTELPSFSEVLGAGTGDGLTPVRSITRRCAHSSASTAAVKSHASNSSRLQIDSDTEIVRYIPDEQYSGGPVYRKLLAQLRAIQVGKAADDFGWCHVVREKDQELENGNEPQTVA